MRILLSRLRGSNLAADLSSNLSPNLMRHAGSKIAIDQTVIENLHRLGRDTQPQSTRLNNYAENLLTPHIQPAYYLKISFNNKSLLEYGSGNLLPVPHNADPDPASGQPLMRSNKAIRVTKALLTALDGKALPRPPFWFMRQAGRYLPEYRKIRSSVPSFLELCYTPDLAAEVTLQPVRRFHPDAAILFSDILVIPDALGQSVQFREGVGPQLEPITCAGDLSRLSSRESDQHLAPVFETVRQVKAQLPDDVALIGFAGSPWTVATYMVEGGTSRDFAQTKLWARKDPAGFDRLLDMLVSATSAYLIGQLEAGADALQLFDTWASAVPADQFDRCVIAPTQRIVAEVRAAAPAAKFIGFPRGVGPAVAHYAAETGVNAVGIDSALSPAYAAQVLQPEFTVQGNLDPMALLAGGAPMLDAAAGILDALGDGPFIFNLGHGVVPQTPPEHVEALAEFVRTGVRR